MVSPIENFTAKAPVWMAVFMDDFDCSVLDAAAVFGNFGHESNGLTTMQEKKPIVPGSKGGWGWPMFTGERRTKFFEYCNRNHLDPASDIANYKYIFVELKYTWEKKAIPALKAAKTLYDKVVVFEREYERAHKDYKHYQSRYTWAQRALAAFEATDKPVPPPPEIEVPPTEEEVAETCKKVAAVLADLHVKSVVVEYVRKSATASVKETSDMTTVVAPVKPATESKINWTQVITFAVQVITMFGLNVPPELIPTLAVVIQGIGTVATIIFRTWYTKSLTFGSVD